MQSDIVAGTAVLSSCHWTSKCSVERTASGRRTHHAPVHRSAAANLERGEVAAARNDWPRRCLDRPLGDETHAVHGQNHVQLRREATDHHTASGGREAVESSVSRAHYLGVLTASAVNGGYRCLGFNARTIAREARAMRRPTTSW
jgi:hypothetical protein